MLSHCKWPPFKLWSSYWMSDSNCFLHIAIRSLEVKSKTCDASSRLHCVWCDKGSDIQNWVKKLTPTSVIIEAFLNRYSCYFICSITDVAPIQFFSATNLHALHISSRHLIIYADVNQTFQTNNRCNLK